ncbi:hypothetical protein GN156_06180 [bacterium LRH843]|nr:hypothetical protein [bacterium LRH843]
MGYKTKSYRKFIAAGLATAVVAAAAPGAIPVSAATSDFTDVDTNAWYYHNVDYLVNKGVLGGYSDNTLRPMATLTRAEAAAMIVNSLNIDVPKNPTLNFKDTKNGVWYTAPVAALVERDILKGFTDGSFKPNATVTRAEFAKMIVKAYELDKKDYEGEAFPDLVPNAWYEEDINTLAAYGIVGGKPNGNFDPNATVLRSESAAFIHRVEVPTERIGYEVELSVDAVKATTNEAGVTTVAASVLGAEKNAEATVELFAKGDTKKAIATATAGVKENAIAANFKELAVGEYVARVTVGKGEAAVSAEGEFTVEALKINEIKGLTTVVDTSTDKQLLAFSVNGETLSLDYLKGMGYTVEFLTSKDVLVDTKTGEVNESKLTAGESFDYQVKVTGKDFELTSKVATVAVESFATSVVSIESSDLLFNGDVKNTSGVISTLDKNISLANIEVEYKDGKTAKLAADHKEGDKNVFTYTSSNPKVALIDGKGNITPISDGKVTFTVKAGAVTSTINATVTSDVRKATKAAVSKDAIGLVTGGADNIALTVTDQFGDAVKSFAKAIDAVVNEDKDSILTATYNGTDKEGKTVVNVKANAEKEGTGKLEIKNEQGDVLTSLNVKVDADKEVATRSLELADPSKDLELDLNKFETADNKVELVLNEYNKSGLKIGGHDFSADKYTISSSDEKVLTVSGTDAKDGKITVTAKEEGSAKVQIKEGSIVRYEATIKVVDTTPTLAGASFANDVKITSTSALNVDDIIDSLTFTGEKGDAKVTYATGENNELIIRLTEGNVKEDVATVTAFSVDVKNAGFYEDKGKFFLGQIVKVNDNSVTNGGFASKTEGTVVLRLNRTGENNAAITTAVSVDVK